MAKARRPFTPEEKLNILQEAKRGRANRNIPQLPGSARKRMQKIRH